MVTENQLNSLKNIYSLMTNISDFAHEWLNDLKLDDTSASHIDKLTIIMNIISDNCNCIEGDLDDIVIIVEENLKEYILEKFAKDSEDDLAVNSENEINNN